MMTTIQDVLGDHTPVSNNVVMGIGLVKGAVVCKIFYTSNLKDRVCRMGLTRLAAELGIDKSTASKTIKWLLSEGYIDQIKAHTPTEPAHYRCTQKFYDLAGGVDYINTGVDLINTPVDLINQEEESEEESEDSTPNGVARTPKPKPIPKTKQHNHPAIQAYRTVYHRYPAKNTYGDIIDKVGHDPPAVEYWQKCLNTWKLRGYKPTRLDGPFEWFDARRIPKANGGKNGRSTVTGLQDANRIQKRVDLKTKRTYWYDTVNNCEVTGPV